jgi:hypothetical protein
MKRAPKMLSAAMTLYLRVLEESFTWLGQSPARVLGLIAIVAVGVLIAYATSGSEGVKLNVQGLAKMLAAPILVWLVIFAIQLFRVPYRAYERQKDAIENLKHSTDVNQPGIQNMTGVIGAFRKFARATSSQRPPAAPPNILISAAVDSKELAWQVTQWAVFAEAGGNGNLQNIGVRPENLEIESRRGMEPNTLLVHAVTETPAILTLVSDLEMLLPTKLVYSMPQTGSPIAPYVIWLQFGAGLRWSNDNR